MPGAARPKGRWIRRLGGKASGFRYADDETGKPVREARVLARIEQLRIPPAWKDVWAFVLLILILVFRPQGLLGAKVVDRA